MKIEIQTKGMVKRFNVGGIVYGIMMRSLYREDSQGRPTKLFSGDYSFQNSLFDTAKANDEIAMILLRIYRLYKDENRDSN